MDETTLRSTNPSPSRPFEDFGGDGGDFGQRRSAAADFDRPQRQRQSSPASSSAAIRGGGSRPAAGKRDISQFVKYLLAGSGIDEDSVDYAALRNELEHMDVVQGGGADEDGQHQQQQHQFSIDMGSSDLPATDGDLDFEELARIRHADGGDDDNGGNRKRQPTTNTTTMSFEEALSELLSRLDAVRAAEQAATTAVLQAPSTAQYRDAGDWTAELLNASLKSAGLPVLPPEYCVAWGADGRQALQSFCRAYQAAVAGGDEQRRQADKLRQALGDISQQASNLAQLYPNALGHSHRPNGKLELENARLQERCHMLEDLVAQTHDRYADLEQRVMSMEEEEERLRVRAEAIIRDVTGHEPTLPRALAGEIREIIAYYEEKQRLLEGELDRLRENNNGNAARKLSDDRGGHGAAANHADGTQTHLARQASSSPARKSTGSPMPASVERMKAIYLDEIQELRDELQAVTAAFEEVQEEKEVLQLKLSTTKVDVGVTPWERKRLPTRELIKRDKEFYKLKLYKVDDMSGDDSKELIKDICRKLKIQSFRKIASTLDDIATTIRLVPQLQQFVYMIDAIVWAPPKVLDQFLTIKEHTGMAPASKNPPHKLSDTVDAIKRWRHMVDHELKMLRGFRQAVHRMVLERDEPAAQNSLAADDVNACLQEIQNLVQYHATKGVSIKRGMGKERATTTRADNDVTMQSLDALLGKVNELEHDWDRVKSPKS